MNNAVKKIVKKIANFENVVVHRGYPLSETMHNLGYSDELIAEIDRKIRAVAE